LKPKKQNSSRKSETSGYLQENKRIGRRTERIETENPKVARTVIAQFERNYFN
jgi:hypothetical protein